MLNIEGYLQRETRDVDTEKLEKELASESVELFRVYAVISQLQSSRVYKQGLLATDKESFF